MENKTPVFTDMQIDAIGEILNISMGSAATAVSNLLDKKVTITTPNVTVTTSGEFHFDNLEPAIGVEINYVKGLDGTNVMILKRDDIKAIVGLLLQTDYSQQEFVMDEMSISAICEVMNQMMGASSTALAQFLNREINISTPVSYPIESSQDFKQKYYADDAEIVCVTFNINIDGIVNSSFVNLMSASLAKELVAIFPSGEEQPTPQPAASAQAAPAQAAPAPAAPPTAAAAPAPEVRPIQQPPESQYQVRPVVLPQYGKEEEPLNDKQSSNLNLIMSVPLQVSVEIGRTQKQIKDILELTTGSIVELNKQAGEQVDIFVNGQQIAKGDVVVVEDMYGVRITEIMNHSDMMKVL